MTVGGAQYQLDAAIAAEAWEDAAALEEELTVASKQSTAAAATHGFLPSDAADLTAQLASLSSLPPTATPLSVSSTSGAASNGAIPEQGAIDLHQNKLPVQSASNAAASHNQNASVEGESTAAAEVPGISEPANAVGVTGGTQTPPEAEQDVPAGVLEQIPGDPASPVEDDGTLVTEVPGGNEGATSELLEGGGRLEEGYVSGSDTSASVPHNPPSTCSPPD